MRTPWLAIPAVVVVAALVALAVLLARGDGDSPATEAASADAAPAPPAPRTSADPPPRLPGPEPGDPDYRPPPADPEAWEVARTALDAAEYAEAIAVCERGLAAGEPDDEVLFDCAIAACATGDAGGANTLIRGLRETRARARVWAMCHSESIEIE